MSRRLRYSNSKIAAKADPEKKAMDPTLNAWHATAARILTTKKKWTSLLL
jgi:hypothetical protein